MSSIDLRKSREAARLSQDELGRRIGVSQAQISRYEEAPENVPFELMLKIFRALGLNPADMMAEASPLPGSGIDPGTPYHVLRQDLKLLRDCIGKAPKGIEELPDGVPTPTDLLTLIGLLGRKPNLALAGPFDAGKSTIANALLGTERLPTAYQPATRVVTYVRHSEDRPEWMKEEVWLLRSGFDARRWDDEEHCLEHRVVAGGVETLRDYGTHGGRFSEQTDAVSAVVYLDAPVLRACNLIDLPGYDNDTEDTDRAKANPVAADFVIYASPFVGFMKSTDLLRLAEVIRNLHNLEEIDPAFPTLGHLFVVASHAAPSISDREISEALEKAAQRTFRHLDKTVLADRQRRTQRVHDFSVIRDRFFSFYLERPDRRERLEQQLKELLTQHLPRVWRRRADKEILDLRIRAKQELAIRLDSYTSMMKELKGSDEELKRLLEQDPRRRARMQEKRKEVEDEIVLCRDEALKSFRHTYKRLVSVEAVEKAIGEHFPDRMDAQGYAAAWLYEQLQHSIEAKNLELGDRLQKKIRAFLKNYEERELALPDGRQPVAIPFNVNGAFAGGLAGAATVGALSIWAASLGNLGGYVIAAKLASVLAGLGISIPGGAATLTSLLALLGGPGVVALGIVSVATLLGAVFFGSSWQRRLATRIVRVFEEKSILSSLEAAVKEWWGGTADAFRRGADEVENRWQSYLEHLSRVVAREGEGHHEMSDLLKRIDAARDFFAGLPWQATDEAA